MAEFGSTDLRMKFSVKGRTAIVTGAASGVGLAVARRFIDDGANVVFADMDVQGLKSEFDARKSNVGYYAGDLREKLTRQNLIATTLSEFERVDILVNASRDVRSAQLISNRESGFLNMMLAQNLIQHYDLSLLVARQFIKQNSEETEFSSFPAGSIVNISTIASQRTHPNLLEYSVSCAALDQLTRSLAVTLAPESIRVNSVALGSVMTARLQNSLAENPEARQEIIKRTPLGRIADASDVASAAQFLCSDAAQFITGQVLTVDGGRTLVDAIDIPCH